MFTSVPFRRDASRVTEKMSNLSSETDLMDTALQPPQATAPPTGVIGSARSLNAALISPAGDSLSAGQTLLSSKTSSGEIMGRSRLEEALRLTRERLEISEQTIGAGTWVWDCATGHVEGSFEWLKLHGFDPQGRLPNWKGFSAILHYEDRERVIWELEESLKDRAPNLSVEYRVVAPDGQICWIKTSARCTYDHLGQLARVTGVCIDISERRRADLFATEAQRDFERFFNLIPDLACIVSTDGYFKKVNPAWETTLGYTREEVLATPMLEFIHPDDLERTLNEVAKQSREYRTKHFVNRYRCKNGSYRLLEWTTTFNRDDSTRFGVARDITEQRISEESLRESEERFRIMADSCPTIIWVTDAGGRTRLANRVCREFIGTPLDQADGDGDRPCLLIHPDDSPEYLRRFLLAVRERAPFRAEARVRRSDGEWRWIASYAEPRFSLSGEFLGHVGISPDITDRKQSEVALQRAKDAAEGANRSKSEFLANMSHEIRTPMNGVIGLTDLVLDTELTPEQREYLEGVRVSADSLLRILNDILDFSKIEAGKLEFEVIEFDLRQTVEAMLKVLGVRASAKNLELAFDLDPDVPPRVLGDPGRLQQILINLTGNAIKFTEHGEVLIRVERLSETDRQVELHFSVKDTGIGIPLSKQQHVFKAFAQADTSSTRTFGGTGLGLTISSQLVEMMGGRIWLESEEGRGSIFHVTLSFGMVPDQREQFGVQRRLFEGMSVLVVDDNDTNRYILDKMLSKQGLKTTVAGSGSAALDALKHAAETGNPFKLIVLDIHMPVMDGLTLTRYIKADPRLSGARIAMLTSGSRRVDVDGFRDLGVSAYLAKPVGEMELLDAVFRMSQVGPKKEAQPDPGVHQDAGQRKVPLHLLLVEDNSVNRIVAARLIEKQNHSVTAVVNGQEALEMIEKENFDCVLMDVQMPVLDGFETTAKIRAKERDSGGHLPIIAMTAHAMTGDLDRCLAAGMDGYITKPIKAKEVLATIERVLGSLNPIP
jgi:PAS domain S-box-containing protein